MSVVSMASLISGKAYQTGRDETNNHDFESWIGKETHEIPIS